MHVDIIDSFHLKSIGDIILLQHEEDGLPNGTVIRLEGTTRTWEIAGRVLYAHADDKQLLFNNETELIGRPQFSNPTDLQAFAERLVQQEGDNIFHYAIEAVGHSAKPAAGAVYTLEI